MRRKKQEETKRDGKRRVEKIREKGKEGKQRGGKERERRNLVGPRVLTGKG